MNYIRFINKPNWDRVLNRKSAVLALYPQLAKHYKAAPGCVNCGTKRRGKAILTYILGDSKIHKKDKKALRQFLPEGFVENLEKNDVSRQRLRSQKRK